MSATTLTVPTSTQATLEQARVTKRRWVHWGTPNHFSPEEQRRGRRIAKGLRRKSGLRYEVSVTLAEECIRYERILAVASSLPADELIAAAPTIRHAETRVLTITDQAGLLVDEPRPTMRERKRGIAPKHTQIA